MAASADLCEEHAAELELCASVYPELTHACAGADAPTTLSLPLARAGASCTLHVELPPRAAAPLRASLSRVRGWLDEAALLAALAQAAPTATPLELCMLASEHVDAVLPPCAICLQAVSGEALAGPCQHPLHRHCGACYAHTVVEARRASPEHAAAKAARAALAAAALGRLKVAEAAADFAQAALEACLARAAELRAQVEAAGGGGGSSGGGGSGGGSGGGGGGAKRALPPSKARRFEAAEEAAAAQALPLPVQLERALAEAEGLRAEAASAQTKLAAARRSDGSGSSSGGSSSSGGGGSPAASEAEEAALQEHLAIAADLALPCPVCRLPIQVPGYPAWARARHLAAAAAGTAVAALPEPREPPGPLPGAVSQGLAELERRFKTLWQRQEARGGIIEAAARRW